MRERLAYTDFELDEESHIKINQELISKSGTGEMLIRCCPAGVYQYAPNGDLQADYAGCLECGTCLQIAPPGSLTWHYPRGGYGVNYQQG